MTAPTPPASPAVIERAREIAASVFDARARKASNPTSATMERHYAKVIRQGEGDDFDVMHGVLLALAAPPTTRGEEAERSAVVGWLRHQSDLGANIGIEAEKGSTKRAAYGGGSYALKRAADEIEAGAHRTNDNEPTRAEIGDEARALLQALKAWSPEFDDRVRPLLLCEAGRRDARDWDREDAENVIAFLLSRLAFAAATPAPAVGDGLREPLHEYRNHVAEILVAATPASVTPDAGAVERVDRAWKLVVKKFAHVFGNMDDGYHPTVIEMREAIRALTAASHAEDGKGEAS